MPNPKPLAEAELPEVPKCCRAHYYNYVAKPRWYLRANIDDAWATMRIEDIDRLRDMASWLERANGIEPQKSESHSFQAMVKRQLACRGHEFAGTQYCVKCGWVPPADYAKTLEMIDGLRRKADRAIALLRNCTEDPVNGVALARIYLDELDPNYVKPIF